MGGRKRIVAGLQHFWAMRTIGAALAIELAKGDEATNRRTGSAAEKLSDPMDIATLAT